MDRSGERRWSTAAVSRPFERARGFLAPAAVLLCVASVLGAGASTALAKKASGSTSAPPPDLGAALSSSFPLLGPTLPQPTIPADAGVSSGQPAATGSTGASGSSAGAASTGATAATGSAAAATSTDASPSGTSSSANASVTSGSQSATAKSPFVLPRGFAPVARYTNPVETYKFSARTLPSDWSAGLWNYGFAATQFQPSQVKLNGSAVSLTAIKKTSPQGYPYESGWISTSGTFSFQYGMVDFRAKMPAGQGLWSALWMASDSGDATEIDIQEMLLGNTHTVYSTLHDWDSPGWSDTMSTNESADLSAGFHDYQLIWQPGELTWAVDGVAYAQYTEAEAQANGQAWPFDSTSVYLIADLAVAGPSEWGGPPTKQTVFPASMQIQSVKVWQ
jgi:beta-glucanase (GH16 family)